MSTEKKILTKVTLKKIVDKHRLEKKTIAFTNGCFDILHFGHVKYLQSAKEGKGDRILMVALNSDSSIRSIKGDKRPIVSENERAVVVAALACVDYVTIFNEPTPFNLIKFLKPDVLIKGADWKGKDIAGGDIVKSYGGKVEFIHYVEGFSTTQIIEKIFKTCQR